MGDQHQAARPAGSTNAPASPARPVEPVDPLALVVPTDAGSRGRLAMTLQRAAGNRAVGASLADIRSKAAQPGAFQIVNAVASTAAPPRGGVQQIAGQAIHAAGVTSLPAPGAPDVVIGAPVKQTDGKWQATINPTSVKPDPATSLYPGPGVHDEAPTATGVAQDRYVSDAASNEIKAGEEEHLTDLEWARHLAYDQVADAVNRAAASGPLTGTSAEDAKAVAMYRVRSEVPDKARWPSELEPITHWRRLYGRLVAVTRERDTVNKWHNITTDGTATASEKKKLGVPDDHLLLSYVAGTTQVGKHKSEEIVKARYDTQAAEPMGNPPASMFTPAPAKPGPTGDFEPQPPGDAVAIRSERANR